MPITKPCDRKGCKNIVKLFPSGEKSGRGKYCSHACRNTDKLSKYEAMKPYIIENYATMQYEEIREHLGLSCTTMLYIVRTLKEENKIPSKKYNICIPGARKGQGAGKKQPKKVIKTRPARNAPPNRNKIEYQPKSKTRQPIAANDPNYVWVQIDSRTRVQRLKSKIAS